MKHIKAALLPGVMLASLTMFSCSDDASDYQSHPPVFSDITFDRDTIYVGEKFVATAVQSSTATLVDRTTYEWTLTENGNEVDITHNYTGSVVYPYAPQDPTDTLTISTAGRYVLTLEARYNISGQSDYQYYNVSSSDNSFSASCMGGAWNYTITMTKIFRVYEKP